MDILINDILQIPDPQNYKLHLASLNEEFRQPLDEFVANREHWVGWNRWRGNRDDWTKPRILSFMSFYHRSDSWLFGGAFDVVGKRKIGHGGYELEIVPEFEKYTGRLLASFHRYQGMRGRAFLLDKYLGQMKVSEVLPQPYVGESFPGFENINHDFSVLETVFRTERPDWKAALSNVKGVYLISDKSNGKQYVGSAYGGVGFWGRWSVYMQTGHGGNDELVALVKTKGPKYARENFRFSVLEVMASLTPDDVVIKREGHWKEALLTRAHGYNKN